MFSGIIEGIGIVKDIRRCGTVTQLVINAAKVFEDLAQGDSIAVDGVCLTAVSRNTQGAIFEIMPQTSKDTTLRFLRTGARVNLQRSLKVGDKISGHFVLGHVDCVGVIRRTYIRQGNRCFDIAIPSPYLTFIVPKGSIAIDGISLTVQDKKAGVFSVAIIPHTFTHTTVHAKAPSDKVNIECDILLKRKTIPE